WPCCSCGSKLAPANSPPSGLRWRRSPLYVGRRDAMDPRLPELTAPSTDMKSITELLDAGVVLGDGGYLIELGRPGYVDSGSGREKVGTGRGSGQFTPEVAIEHPEALRELHREFLHAGSMVLQALTFFGTREKLHRAGYGTDTERINAAAVKLAKEVAGDRALVAGSVSRTQLTEREGMESLDKSRGHIAEPI